MVRNFVATGAVLLAACAGTVRGPSHAPLTVKEIVDRSKPAIVRIESTFASLEPDSEPRHGVGTGFIVAKDGRIVTNLHVIFDPEPDPRKNSGPAVAVQVTLLDGTKLPVRRVVDFNIKRDLAILAIDAGKELPVLTLGDSDRVSTGERVVAIGNPLGVLDYTVSDGLISSVRPDKDLTRLQISAPISQGSSGGPLFNNHGEVIGVAQMIATEGQNLNFGIPSNYIKPLLSQRGGYTLAELREAVLAQLPRFEPTAAVERHIPEHPVAILDSCPVESVAKVFHAIEDAIAVGAPLYNDGEHKACYGIYRGTALMIQRRRWCEPLALALADGVRRAEGLANPSEQAWAMRDAFDGVIIVVKKKIEAGQMPIAPFLRP